jgi:hypothetical protein
LFFSYYTQQRRTLAFSCGARSAFKLKERHYLINMLSRRQLQGLVRHRVSRIETDLRGTIWRRVNIQVVPIASVIVGSFSRTINGDTIIIN